MTPGANPFQNDKLIKKTVLGSLTLRTRDSHKGDFGSVGILGGAPGMSGAVLLTARAALHLGAGKVYAADCSINALLSKIARGCLEARPP